MKAQIQNDCDNYESACLRHHHHQCSMKTTDLKKHYSESKTAMLEISKLQSGAFSQLSLNHAAAIVQTTFVPESLS